MIAILTTGAVALLLSLLGTPVVIRFFEQRGLGQPIRAEGPQEHHSKAGTPTMGGAVIVLSAVIAWMAGHGLPSARVTPVGLLLVGVLVAMAALGFLDDWTKLRRRHSGGMSPTTKFLGQGFVALVVATFGPWLAGIEREIAVTGDWAVDVGVVVFVVWMFLLISGVSNAVNLTDGLDGLAAGTSALVFGAYVLVAFWQFRNPDAFGWASDTYPLDIAMVCAATLGGCAGFLWHNAPPARIFMGDTGSLALGGLLAVVATATGTQLLLVVVGAVFVAETTSVILQVAVFKATKRAAAAGRRDAPRRLFRMTPLHHHFELLGWQETTIIVRFWIAAGIGIGLGLGVFYGESLGRVIEVIQESA